LNRKLFLRRFNGYDSIGMLNRARFTFIVPAVAFLLLLVGHAQNRDVWRDPSPHSVRFVTVEPNVQLEVLDWGGSGRPLILLNGLGGTAHGFDDFAPKLTSIGHIYGITRRGFGSSSAPPSGYGADRLGDDVLSVMNRWRFVIRCWWGNRLAAKNSAPLEAAMPGRVSGLVYLDAGYFYAFDNGKGAAMEEFLRDPPAILPPQDESDLVSFRALQAWSTRNFRATFPEAELRQMFTASPDGHVGMRTISFANAAILAGVHKYIDISAPILAIFAIPHDPGPWVNNNADAKTREAIAAFDVAAEKQAKAFEDGLPSARVMRLPHAAHEIFLSNEADVLREMRAFLASLH
jgi:non-heme chloroperoxidase